MRSLKRLILVLLSTAATGCLENLNTEGNGQPSGDGTSTTKTIGPTSAYDSFTIHFMGQWRESVFSEIEFHL